MKPAERFSNRADNYQKYRPGYPSGVIELIRRECGEAVPLADIGAGTGILTKLLLDAGYPVTAIEPNQPMRNIAEQDLAIFPRFTSLATTAEKTGLPDRSVQVITVAQAFHWFNVEEVSAEFRRILMPRGKVFLIWNHRRLQGSRFCQGYEDLLLSLGEAYNLVSALDQKDKGEQRRQQFFLHNEIRHAQFENPQIMDWAGLRGRFLSSSYVPAKGDARHEEMLSKLEELFLENERAGQVVFEQTTEVYFGTLTEI